MLVLLIHKNSLFHHLKVFLMHATDGDGVAGKVHDELAVALDADDVAFLTCKGTGEDAQTDVTLDKLDEGITHEGDAIWSRLENGHEGAHHAIGDGCGAMGGAVVTKIVLWKILTQKGAKLARGALQKYESANGGYVLLGHALAIGLLTHTHCAVDEALGAVIAFEMAMLQAVFKDVGRHVLDANVAPGDGRIGCVLLKRKY